jgi:hypothetical protein
MEPVPVSLAGLKVLDLSRMLPGPYCSMILADHGDGGDHHRGSTICRRTAAQWEKLLAGQEQHQIAAGGERLDFLSSAVKQYWSNQQCNSGKLMSDRAVG